MRAHRAPGLRGGLIRLILLLVLGGIGTGGVAAQDTSGTAETLLSPAEFEELSTGNTLTFDRAGQRYGAEQYLSDRRVIWQFSDGTCSFGTWFARDGALCFVYDTGPGAQCWVFARRGSGFFVRSLGELPGAAGELSLSGISTQPLACQAPNLGV